MAWIRSVQMGHRPKLGTAMAAAMLCLSIGGCGNQGPGQDAGADETSTGDTTTTGETSDATSESSTGSTCDCPGGVCIDDVCCAADKACGDVCCGDDELCGADGCAVPGDDCVSASNCAEDEFCDHTLGDPSAGGCPAPPTGKCAPLPDLPACEHDPAGGYDVAVKYSVDTSNSMMAPVVTQLDDDNCDGVVDQRDRPDILFSTFEETNYSWDGTLRAVTIIDGSLQEKWTASAFLDSLRPGAGLAVADLDGIPGAEIVSCTITHRVRVFDGNGNVLWLSDYDDGCETPTIADLDRDGVPEIVAKGGVLSIYGETLTVFPEEEHQVIPANLDDDGDMEIVSASRVMAPDGQVLIDTGLLGWHFAIADLDSDGIPEIIAADSDVETASHWLDIWSYDPMAPNGYVIVRQGLDLSIPIPLSNCPPEKGGSIAGGGPPLVADLDGDGNPDVGIAVGVGYLVLDGAKLMDPDVADAETFAWSQPSQDCSSGRSSATTFDFDADGANEVIYSDERQLWIFDGSDGTILFEGCSTSGTLIEHPVVADADGDGFVDIVSVANDYIPWTCPIDDTKQRGMRILGDLAGNWARTRAQWNQHAYHITNVRDDTTIPDSPPPHWSTPETNAFRSNSVDISAPDLVASVWADCQGDYKLIARVRNMGRASVPAGVAVGFYRGDPGNGDSLGSGVTPLTLGPGEPVDVELVLADPPADIVDGTTPVTVVVDDGMAAHPWHECRTDNNSAMGSGECP